MKASAVKSRRFISREEAGFAVMGQTHLTLAGRQDRALIRARRPAGAQADFRVNLSGHLSYKFHWGIKGKRQRKDAAPVMDTLQDAYGIKLRANV